MRSIFNGNKVIDNAVAKALGYNIEENRIGFTRDMYLSTFFYLSKRFGNPTCFDTHKEAGAWSFKVKNYIIQIRLNSHWVDFIVFGDKGCRIMPAPFIVKYIRERNKKRHLIIDEFSEWDEAESKRANDLYKIFHAENLIPPNLSQEEFDKQYGMQWYERVLKHNDDIININTEEFSEKYGLVYQNSYTKHALRTLIQFINNMFTPIFVRDCAYNIKGFVSESEYDFFIRYENNIKIEFISENL